MTHPYSPPPVGREQEGEQEGARGKPSSAAQQGKEWLFGIAKRMVGSLRRATMGLSPEVNLYTSHFHILFPKKQSKAMTV